MHLDAITKSIGVALIILGFLNFTSLISLDPLSLMCFSITAVAFAIIDLLEMKADEQGNPFKFRKYKEILYFFGIFSFIVIPYIHIPWNENIVARVGNFSSLVSIGLVFILISLKQKQIMSVTLRNIMNEMIENEMQDYKENHLANDVNKLMNKEFIRETVNDTIDEIISKQNIS
jgi:hypothetical protein